MTRPRPVVPLVLLLVFAAPASAQDSPLDRYIRMGLEANLELARHDIVMRQADARWAQSRASYLPSLSIEARYSRAEGGRTFDVPVGDLLNPVYSTLNGLVGSPQFPVIGNQELPLLRDREQDTHLRVTQVIWNPALRSDVRSKRLQVDAARAGTEAARRALVRDIRIAYYQYANATRAEAILDAAVELVAENERSSSSLWRTSLATRDQVHRARAERLEVEAQRTRAETDRQLAASYLNYLLRRDSRADIELSEEDLALPDAGQLGQLRRVATDPEDDAWIEALIEQALSERPELEQLDHAVAAAEAGLGAVRGSTLPSVAMAVDAGIQGREYGFGPDHRYVLASLVLSWSVTDGGGERARVREAALERDRLRNERDDAAARVRLELETAAHNARMALTNLSTSAERVLEAEGAFRLVRRRREEGLATSLEFLDARASLTRAQLSASIGETEALIRLAELEYAAGEVGDALPRSTQQWEDER